MTEGAALPLAAESASAAFSTLVFRHFDDMESGAAYFREIRRILEPGGTLMIELPLHVWPSPNPLFTAIHSLEKRLGSVRASFWRSQLRRGKGQPFWRRLTYDLSWLQRTLVECGLEDIQFRIFTVESRDVWHSCVLARKSRSTSVRPLG
jgi:SAM-dependent methyltransferase